LFTSSSPSGQLKSTGLDVFNHVAGLLGIKELYFFGLTVVKGTRGPAAPASYQVQIIIVCCLMLRLNSNGSLENDSRLGCLSNSGSTFWTFGLIIAFAVIYDIL